MEDFNKNKNYQANSQNSWEELSEIDPNLERQKEIEQIKNKISELEQQDEKIQAQIQEALKLTREVNSEEMGDVHSYGNFLDRANYEIERLKEQSYKLSVEISGLEFKLSKLEENQHSCALSANLI